LVTEEKGTDIDEIKTTFARLSDVDGMAKCHIDAFPGQFMTEMGKRWLRGLYSFFIRHDNGISIVALNRSGKVLGLAVGGAKNIRDEFLKKAVFKFPGLLLRKFLTCGIVRRKLLRELLRRLHLKRRNSESADLSVVLDDAYYGVLLSMGVFQDYQGKTVADRLMEAFKREAQVKYDKLRLTVRTDNKRAIAFYTKHNWYEVGRAEDSIKFQLDLTVS